MSTESATETAGRVAAATARRIVTSVQSLSDLVGAHPDALRKIYGQGVAADPADLGSSPRGRILAFEPGGELFLLTRPLVRAFAFDGFPWRGKTFDHGGNAGQNVIFGKPIFRFRTERGPSDLDGQPTLWLFYDSPAFGNPWPVRAICDELRSIGSGIAIGPTFVTLGGKRRLVAWFGLESSTKS